MARAELRMDLRSTGTDLRTIASELRRMDDRKVRDLFRGHLQDAARPFARAVQASVLATPAKRPPGPDGLRARIARCAEVVTWGTGRQVSVAVEIDPRKMPDREMSLPLMYEGAKRFRHPVFGRSEDPWVQEPAKPYFHQAADGFGRAAGAAMRAALDDITGDLNGRGP